MKHAHSEWFNVLSELGIVGLVLFVASMLLFVATSFRNPFRDRGDPMRSLVVALQAGIVAFLVHISWDWDWDMAAIGFVFFLFVTVSSSYLATRAADARRGAAREQLPEASRPAGDSGRRAGLARRRRRRARRRRRTARRRAEPGARAPSRRWPVRAAATAALVLLAVSWGVPYLARARPTPRSRSRPAATRRQP